MSVQQISRALATSLHQTDWTHFDIARVLTQRLPAHLRALAPTLARELRLALPYSYAPPEAVIATTLAQLAGMANVSEYAQKHQLTPSHELQQQAFRPIHAFAGLDLPPLSCREELAEWLALSPDQLTRFADLRELSNQTNNAFAPHYRFHVIPKRDGSPRLIEEPKPVLKRLQRRILKDLLYRIPPSRDAYGFVPGRNCLQAAARHAGEALVVSFDLRSWFLSVKYPRIFGLFRCLGYPVDVARDLTGLCTLRTPPIVRARLGSHPEPGLNRKHLPQGAPTSPALANFCSFNLDRRLAGLARRLDATFTRYADDLTFSGDASIASGLLHAVPAIAQDEGFAVNLAKTRTMLAHRQQVCTGVVINQHTNISRRDYDRLKAQIHHLKNPNDPCHKEAAKLSRLSGQIAWVEQVNPAKGAKLRERFEGPCCTNQLRGSFYESSVVAGGYEQLVPYEVQDQELAFVQHGAKAARFAINLV